MNNKYQTPCIEAVSLKLFTVLADSFDGTLEDMTGEMIFDDNA